MSTMPDGAAFVRRVLIVIGLTALALLLWHVAYALLLAFGGILFAVFLRGVAGKLRDWTGLGMGISLVFTGLALVALFVLAALLVGPAIAAQMAELGATLGQGAEKAHDYLMERPWGRELLEGMSSGAPQGSDVLRAAARVFAGATDAVVALVLILFAGIYFAATPHVYSDGVVRLVPGPRQARMREVLRITGRALWLWLLGRFVVMALVAAITTLGLLLVGVPLAIPLGIIAGLLEFIPFFGPVMAAVPIILVALTIDPQTALYASILVLVIQQTESQLLEPLIERRAVALPPVIVLVGTIASILLFGIVGAVFATPLLVVAMVFVELLYVEDVLGQRVKVPGRAEA